MNVRTTYTLKRALRFAAPFGLAILLFAGIGCDTQPTEVQDYVPQPFLTAYISNGVPVRAIHLERVGTYNAFYSPSKYGIDNAQIRLFPVLDTNGDSVDIAALPDSVLTFSESPDTAGLYLADRDDYLPLGRVRYRIEVSKSADDITMWAETTVPDTFQLVTFQNNQMKSVDGDTLRRTDPEIFVAWTPSATCGGYVLGIQAQTPRDSLVPLDPSWDPNDPADSLKAEQLDRYNYTIARYDQRAMTVAWIFFRWAGWNRLDIQASSEEYFRYVFTHMLSNDPNNPANPEMNVHGGLGIFGATARNSFRIYLERVKE